MTPEPPPSAAQGSPGWPASVPPVVQASPSAYGPPPFGQDVQAAPPFPGAPVPGSPPRGPGVVVPFGAPPTERNRKRLWITLGITGALLLLCCGGGFFGFVVFAVRSSQATEAASVTVVHDYLEGLRTGNFDRSYDQLCQDLRQQTSRTEFRDTQQSRPALQSYTVGAPRSQSSGVTVTASLLFSTGDTARAEFFLVPERGSLGSVKICGIRQ